MRPTRLELSGFTAFRDPVVVDFTDAELFAFTGPTGSGKSSLIDAIVFTLYGCIPRLDRRAVAPIISLGRAEARLRLDFTVGGAAYTAVRVVRRTAKGATTKEARLEAADGTVLAGNEKELTAEVVRLLGLDFAQFTTCVVLPQGNFAQLLHAAPSERQDLLISLLDLGLYERMARLARAREARARADAEVATTLLNKLSYATPEARDAAAARVEVLEALRDELEAAEPALAALDAAEQAARSEATEASARLQRLAAVVVPGGLDDHQEALATARARAGDAAAAEVEAADRAETAEAALSQLPGRQSLERLIEQHDARDRHRRQLAKGTALVAERQEVETDAAATLEQAEALAQAAADHLEAVRWHHRADDLAGSLSVGEPCPVCRREVDELPALDPPADVDVAVAARSQADAEVKQARRAHSDAQRAVADVEAKLTSIREQLAELDAVLDGQPDEPTLRATLAEVVEAEAAERQARDAATAARRAAVAATRAVQQVEEAEVVARRTFEEVRDRVAALEPPSPGRVDLAADWAELAAWAADRRPVLAAEVEAAAERAGRAATERAGRTAELVRRCADAGVEVGRRAPHHAAADAAAKAVAVLAEIDRAVDDAAGYRADLDAHSRRAAVARELARLLNANHFEKWVLDEALGMLVEGATGLLRDLSDGAYSLGLDDNSAFLVVDHRNADEQRSARTLSGGETFLASLALALALADHVGSLASQGAARLESVFLDEGFGTLDPETLDTVAAAIEELGSRGRMVGLISHVPELAERVPVRFEVTKSVNSSTVRKVVA